MIRAIVETKEREVGAMRGVRHPGRVKPVIPLNLDGPVNIIAELKRKSPSAGAIGEVGDERIHTYTRYAKAVSVLTDGTYFGGSFDFLREVAMKTTLPVLCKDFIIDESQIDLAYAMGADMVLLIVRILGAKRLAALYAHAGSLGLECLVEIHGKEELREISGLAPRVVGVNARNLDTLEIDLDTAAAVLTSVTAPVRIAESGIRTRADMERFGDADAYLIGEALMRSRDLDAAFRGLMIHG